MTGTRHLPSRGWRLTNHPEVIDDNQNAAPFATGFDAFRHSEDDKSHPFVEISPPCRTSVPLNLSTLGKQSDKILNRIIPDSGFLIDEAENTCDGQMIHMADLPF